jgi:hypothetical protein
VKKNSASGNPRFTVIFLNPDRDSVSVAVTAPDSALAYGIQNYYGKWVEFTTIIKRSRVTLDSIRESDHKD